MSEKLELFQVMENRTSREIEAKLAEARGEKLKVKLVLELDEELEALWTEVKTLRVIVRAEIRGKSFEFSRKTGLIGMIRNGKRLEVGKHLRPQKYAIELDHKQPFALGGKNTAENLRLLCKSCNTFEAVRAFGVPIRRKTKILVKNGISDLVPF